MACLVKRRPLDGGRILVGILPKPAAMAVARLELFGLVVLIGLLIILPIVSSSGALSHDDTDLAVPGDVKNHVNDRLRMARTTAAGGASRSKCDRHHLATSALW